MALVHGRDISAKDVEWLVGRGFNLEQFAALCNSIAWAEGRAIGLKQVSFTERVYVKDNGIDAEWTLDMPLGQAESPLVKPGLKTYEPFWAEKGPSVGPNFGPKCQCLQIRLPVRFAKGNCVSASTREGRLET